MSASERLRELRFADEWPDPDFSQRDGKEIWEMIVAVVAAAEKMRANEAFAPTHLDHALTALDAKLSACEGAALVETVLALFLLAAIFIAAYFLMGWVA